MMRRLFLPIAILTLAAGPAIAETPEGSKTLGELIFAGGYLMIPIGLLSIIAVAYTIERLVALRRRKIVPPALFEELQAAVDSGNIEEAVRLCENEPSPLSNVVLAGLRRRERPLLEIEKGMEDAGLREVEKLRRNIRAVRVVASVAPLLGLLGTVWGMIAAFQNVAEQHAMGRMELLAKGIYEALVTTGAGLTVAIPALLAFHYLMGLVGRLVLDLDDKALWLIDRLVGHESQV